MENAKKTDNSDTTKRFSLNVAHFFLFFLLIIVVIACYKIIEPFLNVIILAAILAMVLNPIHLKILKLVKDRRNLAAVLTCVFLTLVVIIPLTVMLISVIQQGIDSFNSINDWIAKNEYKELLQNHYIKGLISWFEGKLPYFQKLFPNLDIHKLNLNDLLLNLTANIGKILVNQGGNLLSNVTSIFMKFFLMIFVFFYIIRDEAHLLETILHYSPLSASQENQILDKIRDVSRSALIGTLVTALAQGAVGGIAFWISGLPALFWGMVMAFASLIPLVGTALIWVPAAGYLLISGHWGYAIFVVIWCSVIVGMLDNFVRPLFMKGSAGMSTLLIFLSLLGGIGYFGILGILYGPLIFGLAMVLFYIYSVEFNQFLNIQDEK